MAKNEPPLSKEYMSAFAEALAAQDFESAMMPVVRAYLTPKDVEAVNAFLSVGAGKEEITFMLELYQEISKGIESASNVNQRRDRFYATLTEHARHEIRAFRDSQSGRRYWASLAPIEQQFTPVFKRLAERAIHRAIVITKDRDDQARPNKAPEPTPTAVTSPAAHEPRQP